MRVDKSKWEKVRLIDVAPICPSSENSANSVVWLLNLDMIESQTGKIIRKQYCDIEEVGSSVIQFTKSHVLWSKLRPYLNKVVLPDEDGYATSELIPLLPNRIEREYLAYLLMSKWFVAKMVASSEGARMPRASMKEFRKLMIALPSDKEQRAIAEELDSIQSMIGKCRDQLEDYDRLARSIFHEMFGSTNNTVTIGDVCMLKSGDSSANNSSDGTLPYVKVGDMNLNGNEEFITKSSRYVSETENIRAIFPVGSVVFPKRGGAILTNKIRLTKIPICCDLNVMGVYPKNQALLTDLYLFHFFKTIDFGRLCDGAAIPQINNKDIAPLQIPLPPQPLQQQFAARIEVIEEMKETTKAQLADLQQLFDSRMQYYFS